MPNLFMINGANKVVTETIVFSTDHFMVNIFERIGNGPMINNGRILPKELVGKDQLREYEIYNMVHIKDSSIINLE
uniref:Uncharacterized protein n=1 Tax=Heterorhabditis bacteriophora TaxID=37862 RepID=A0A1I7XFI2_HETBA